MYFGKFEESNKIRKIKIITISPLDRDVFFYFYNYQFRIYLVDKII